MDPAGAAGEHAAGPLAIGDPRSGKPLKGEIGDLRIYDRPLSSFEVAALYEVGGRTAPAPGTCTETCKLTPP